VGSLVDQALELRSIVVPYPGLRACDGAGIELRTGEIHSLVGENGAGKSTLMHVAAGLLRPRSGSILVNGRNVVFGSPTEAQANGIAMVFQSFLLVDRLTVLDNVLLGWSLAGRILRREEMASELYATCSRIGLDLDLNAPVSRLSAGDKQKAALLRALSREARILILDEPTAVLTPAESERLLDTMRALARSGISIIFVSHKLPEIMAVTDRITVMNRGRTVASGVPVADVSPRQVAELMIGRPLAGTTHPDGGAGSGADSGRLRRAHEPETGTAVGEAAADVCARKGGMVLRLRSVSVVDTGVRRLDRVDLELRSGQVIGIAGVSGNGQRELAEVCAGVLTPGSGGVELFDMDVTGSGAASRLALGLRYLCEDRYREGADPELTIEETCALKDYGQLTRGRLKLLDPCGFSRLARLTLESFGVVAPGIRGRTGALSGGNLQKLLVGRELFGNPKVIVAHQPTQGLDISATECIRGELKARAAAGCALLLVSSDLDEILELADEIRVMYRGRLLPAVERARFDRGAIGAMMAGVLQ